MNASVTEKQEVLKSAVSTYIILLFTSQEVSIERYLPQPSEMILLAVSENTTAESNKEVLFDFRRLKEAPYNSHVFN